MIAVHLYLKRYVLAFALATLVPIWPNGAFANGAGEAAKQALDEAANFPWYDADAGTLRQVVLPAQNEPPPVTTWKWPKWFEGDWSRDWDWGDWSFDFGQVISSIFEFLMWALLIGLIVAIVTMLVRVYLEGEGFGAGLRAGSLESDGRRTDEERIENLPFDVKAAQTDLLAQADRLRGEGRYGEALVYLFSYQLVQSDKRHLIRLTKGKTNRQYLREIGSRRDLKRIMGATMVAFEDYFFGNHTIERKRFESLWSGLDEFRAIIDSETEETSLLSQPVPS